MQINRELSDELYRLFTNLGHAVQHSPETPVLSTVTFSLLAALARSPRRGSDLVPILGLDQSTISRRTAALCEAGLVEKVRDPNDGRAHLLRPTPAGPTLVERERARRVRTLTDALGTWSDTDRGDLARLLNQLNSTLDARRVPTDEETRD